MAETPPDLAEAKRRLRRDLFARLKAMAAGEKAAESERVRARIASQPEFCQAAVVAAYVSLPSEPDLDPLIDETWGHREWCLPRVTEAGSVEMRQFSGWGSLITGEFGIREPDPGTCRLVSVEEIDLVLLPGVGFDPANGARLGRGKGHYDRFLERLRASTSPPLVLGVCFSGQRLSIEPEPHDQPIDAILTGEGIEFLPNAG